MNNYDENQSLSDMGGANGPISSAKLKEYGKKAYSPLINVVFKYQDEITPYLNALSKGLHAGVDALNKEGSNDQERYVSRFFREAADGIGQACEKLQSHDVKAFTTYLSDMADKKPSIMFSTSYIAGLFFGRLGRHMVRTKGGSGKTISNEPPSFDQSIH
ncbi:MAG: hypothetical protein ACLGHN_05595 [Bacteriovoracia bacterium]